VSIYFSIKNFIKYEGIQMKSSYRKITLLLLTSFIVIGCSGTSPKNSPQNERIAKSFKTSSQYAQVYLYTEVFVGPSGAPIFIDNKSIGVLGQSTFLLAKIKPGQHTITCVFPGNTVEKTLFTKANKNYFVAFDRGSNSPDKGSSSKVSNFPWILIKVNTKEGKRKISKLHMLKTSQSTASHTRKRTKTKATKVNPSIYRKYSCKKLNSNILSVNSQLSGLIEVQSQAKIIGGLAVVASVGTTAVNMQNTPRVIGSTGSVTKSSMPVGPLLATPNVNNASIPTQISSLLGQYDAMKIVAKEKKCGFASKLK